MPPIIRRRLLISGLVQGVWFRQSTKDEAERIGGLHGFVRNLDDGRVEVVVQGDVDAVERLVSWCRGGPANARVDDLQVTEEAPTGPLGPFHVTS